MTWNCTCCRFSYRPVPSVCTCVFDDLTLSKQTLNINRDVQANNLGQSSIRGGIFQPFFPFVTGCTLSSFTSRGIHSHLFPYCCYLKVKALKKVHMLEACSKLRLFPYMAQAVKQYFTHRPEWWNLPHSLRDKRKFVVFHSTQVQKYLPNYDLTICCIF